MALLHMNVASLSYCSQPVVHENQLHWSAAAVCVSSLKRNIEDKSSTREFVYFSNTSYDHDLYEAGV